MNSITSLSDDKEDESSEKTVKPKYMYIMSGAEGYIDFRIGMMVYLKKRKNSD